MQQQKDAKKKRFWFQEKMITKNKYYIYKIGFDTEYKVQKKSCQQIPKQIDSREEQKDMRELEIIRRVVNLKGKKDNENKELQRMCTLITTYFFERSEE